MLEFNEENHAKMVQSLRAQRTKLGAIINPFRSENLTQKQTIELNQVGKFLTLLNKPSHIITHSDSPDFIISYGDQQIGLEHERVFKDENVSYVRSIKKLFFDASKIFESTYPGITLHAECYLNTDNFKFKKNEAEQLQKEIAQYIFQVYQNHLDPIKPYFIDEVSLMRYSGVSFSYNSGAHWVSNIDKTTLERAISKKNGLVKKYKVNSGKEEQWLLIVIGNASPDSYEFEENQFQIEIETTFDKVILMDDFKMKAWQII